MWHRHLGYLSETARDRKRQDKGQPVTHFFCSRSFSQNFSSLLQTVGTSTYMTNIHLPLMLVGSGGRVYRDGHMAKYLKVINRANKP